MHSCSTNAVLVKKVMSWIEGLRSERVPAPKLVVLPLTRWRGGIVLNQYEGGLLSYLPDVLKYP